MGPRNDINLEDILADKPAENDLMEVPLTNRIFKVFFGVIFVIAIAVFIQFGNISIIDHPIYTRIAFANITQAEIESAPRGLIKDRFGDVIVDNEPSFRAFLSPRGLPKNTRERKEIFEKISTILNIDQGEINKKIEEHDWRLGNLLLKKDISHDELVSLSSENIPGLKTKPGFSRVLRDPKAFSHIVGYTGLVDKKDIEKKPNFVFEDEVGKSGLELYYDQVLRGQNGKELAFMDANMNVKERRVLAEPKTGETLELFIDAPLQEYFHQRLLDQIRSLNADGGVGLAVNPQNGEVLSLVSLPTFKINEPAKYLDYPNQPFFNRAIQGLYSPGSTIKPLVATAALEENIVEPTDQFLSTGQITVPNPYDPRNPSVFKDWKPHGWVNLYSAIARSSNVYFYIVGGGYKDQPGLGISRLYKWWQKFNLDEKTGIDLLGEKTGFLPTQEWKEKKYNEPWRVGDTYNVSIGQGQLIITPLELLNYVSAVSNGGKINKFRIAKRQKPEVIKDIGPEISDSLEKVRAGMKDAVDKPYGTAYYLSNLPVEVGAKTGTAQVGGHETNAFFVGFAPFKEPEIAILILIENSAEGGLNTTPVANDVLSWYYQNRIKNSTE